VKKRNQIALIGQRIFSKTGCGMLEHGKTPVFPGSSGSTRTLTFAKNPCFCHEGMTHVIPEWRRLQRILKDSSHPQHSDECIGSQRHLRLSDPGAFHRRVPTEILPSIMGMLRVCSGGDIPGSSHRRRTPHPKAARHPNQVLFAQNQVLIAKKRPFYSNVPA